MIQELNHVEFRETKRWKDFPSANGRDQMPVRNSFCKYWTTGTKFFV
jgi:hypothetical protein